VKQGEIIGWVQSGKKAIVGQKEKKTI